MIRKKLAMAMIIVLGIGCLLLNGCASALKVAMITGGVGKIAESRESRMTTEKSFTTAEEYTIGENIVKIYSAGNNCIIRAFNNKGNFIKGICFKKSDLDMPPAEKIIYIYEFFKATGTDLGPIEPEIVTQKTAPAPASVTDIPISSFAPVSY